MGFHAWGMKKHTETVYAGTERIRTYQHRLLGKTEYPFCLDCLNRIRRRTRILGSVLLAVGLIAAIYVRVVWMPIWIQHQPDRSQIFTPQPDHSRALRDVTFIVFVVPCFLAFGLGVLGRSPRNVIVSDRAFSIGMREHGGKGIEHYTPGLYKRIFVDDDTPVFREGM
jgi:hypothetical protein